MSTSEAQIIARALYDSLVNSTLQTLRSTATTLANAGVELTPERVEAALPTGAPREVKNLVLALVRDGKIGQLDAVVRSFEGYIQTPDTKLTGDVTSAVELTPEQKQLVVADLRKQFNQTLEIAFSVDPSLIGGLIIRVGDQVLDNSLRARLSAVQRNLLAS